MHSTTDFTAVRQRLSVVYDPELVHAAGHQLVDQLSEHLRRVQAGEGDVLPWCDPDKAVQEATSCLERYRSSHVDRQQVVRNFSELVSLMLSRGQNLHNPRYIGHQVPASAPVAKTEPEPVDETKPDSIEARERQLKTLVEESDAAVVAECGERALAPTTETIRQLEESGDAIW